MTTILGTKPVTAPAQPQYLATPQIQPGEHVYGDVAFDEKENAYIIKAEPCVIELCKRMWPGSASRRIGDGRARIPATQRSVGDLNWLLLRYPMTLSTPERYDADMQRALAHAHRRNSLDTIDDHADLPPTFLGELLPFQKKALNFAHKNEKNLLAMDVGLGKAQPLDAKVLTPLGWKAMGDIHVGDTIVNSAGKTSRVTGVFPQGEKEIFRVTFSDGAATECCADHLWAVHTDTMKHRNKTGHGARLKTPRTTPYGAVMTTAELRADLVRKNGRAKWYVPMVGAVEFADVPLPMDPYLLGALLGDGSFRRALMISGVDGEILDRVRRALPPSLELRQKPSREGFTNCDYQIALRSREGLPRNPLISTLRNLGLWCHLSHEKFIPSAYLYAGPEARMALLQGLFDTDGCSSHGTAVEFTTTSAQLAMDVRFLSQSFGATVRLSEKTTTYVYKGVKRAGRLAYRLHITFPATVQPFHLARKAKLHAPGTKYEPTRAIVSIEPVGRKPAQCISVDAPDRLYVTDDFILTHNTIVGLALSALVRARRTVIVVQTNGAGNMMPQWRDEIGRFIDVRTGQRRLTPDTDETPRVRGSRLAHLIQGRNQYKLPNVPYYILHYDLLRDWKDALLELNPDLVIFDEVQNLRHTETARYSAASLLSSQAPRVLGLSATPIHNYGIEMWSVMNIIEHHCLADKESFGREWCDGYHGKIVNDPELLGDYLRREGLVWRARADDPEVNLQLPPVRRSVHTIEHDETVFSKLIENATRASAEYHTTKDWHTKGKLARIIDQESAKACGVSKAPFAGIFVDSLLDAGNRVIVYAHHHEVHEILKEKLARWQPARISGLENNAEKAEAKRRFIERETPVLILALRGGSGLDGLQKSGNVCVFSEIDWSPSIHFQSEGRLRRMGHAEELDKILSYYLVSRTGIDELKRDRLGVKVGQITGILGDAPETEEDRLLSQKDADGLIEQIAHTLVRPRATT